MFGLSLPPVVCRRVDVLFTLFVFTWVVVSNTYCVVFLSCFSLPCVHYGASFSGFTIFDSPYFWFDILQRLFILYWPFNQPSISMKYLRQSIRLFRIISIPSTFYYFRPLDHMISMECSALDFRCQCTQQKLQSICAVLTFDIRILITPLVFTNSFILKN
jgi:hypothetical protein